MRLLVATPLYPPESGGPATYAKALEDGLLAHNIEIRLVKFGAVKHLLPGIRTIVYFWHVFRAAEGADLVLALDPASTGFPAWCAAFLRHKRFVVKIVGDYAWEQGRQRFGIWQALDEFVYTKNVPFPVLVFRAIQKFVAARALRIIVPSEYLKRIVMAWGIPGEKISVIANAHPVEKLGEVPQAVADLPSPRIVTVGRLVPWKGMHGVIAAVQMLREELPTTSLAIVGDGPDRGALERYARVRLKEGYHFTGSLPHADTLAVMQSADVFVLNSSYEGLSHLLLEALALGKTIVATKAGGNVEVIEHGVNGLLVSVGDTQGLAEVLVSVLKDEAGRKRLEAEAKASAARYEPATMITATAELLTSVV